MDSLYQDYASAVKDYLYDPLITDILQTEMTVYKSENNLVTVQKQRVKLRQFIIELQRCISEYNILGKRAIQPLLQSQAVVPMLSSSKIISTTF